MQDKFFKFDPYNVNAICCFIVIIFLIFIVALFMLKWRRESTPIMQVLTILLINEILYSASQVIGYINNQDNLLCTISIIGRMAFSVAANFWIIFITRLVYMQALAPGKYFNILNFVFKNIVLTYIPSIILSIFLLIVININNTQSESQCWQIITNKQALDYVIFITTFILPNFLTSLVLLVYMLLLYRLPATRKWTVFLAFSITSLLFSVYFIVIRFVQLFNIKEDMAYYNLLMLGQPIVYGILFVLIYIRQRKKTANSSDLTIRSSENEASFIEDL